MQHVTSHDVLLLLNTVIKRCQIVYLLCVIHYFVVFLRHITLYFQRRFAFEQLSLALVWFCLHWNDTGSQISRTHY